MYVCLTVYYSSHNKYFRTFYIIDVSLYPLRNGCKLGSYSCSSINRWTFFILYSWRPPSLSWVFPCVPYYINHLFISSHNDLVFTLHCPLDIFDYLGLTFLVTYSLMPTNLKRERHSVLQKKNCVHFILIQKLIILSKLSHLFRVPPISHPYSVS